MSKFDFEDKDAAWKSISGKKWERPIALGDNNFRLFHDIDEKVEFLDYNSDGKVLDQNNNPISGHLDNILGGWTEPFARRPITESVTEVVEEEVAKPFFTEEMIAAMEEMRRDKQPPERSASHRRFDALVDSTIDTIRQLSELKGGEYAGDLDRLANFRRNGITLGVSMETVWAVYANKHHDAIMQYIKDINSDTSRPRSEPISGRVDDLIVYLILFKMMVEERDDAFGERIKAAGLI